MAKIITTIRGDAYDDVTVEIGHNVVICQTPGDTIVLSMDMAEAVAQAILARIAAVRAAEEKP